MIMTYSCIGGSSKISHVRIGRRILWHRWPVSKAEKRKSRIPCLQTITGPGSHPRACDLPRLWVFDSPNSHVQLVDYFEHNVIVGYNRGFPSIYTSNSVIQ